MFFEVGCIILVAVTLGRWLEASDADHAGDGILRDLLPDPCAALWRRTEKSQYHWTR